MESDFLPSTGVWNGINLANYFPNQRSFNTVTYTHKRFLKHPEAIDTQAAHKSNLITNVEQCKEQNKDKHDKAQQFDGITTNEQKHYQKGHINTISKNDTVLNQTIRFAKNLTPLIIPPGDSPTPVFYTIKTNKSKSKNKKICKRNVDMINDTAKSKKVTESYRKENIMHHVESSIKESVYQSSQNTLDEMSLNESLSCTISDLSEKKSHKREKRYNKTSTNDNQKYVISNSFEALAAETVDTKDGSKIKIHLMNDTDKTIFRRSLQVPIIKAIKEYISELNHYESNINSELKILQRLIKCNSKKLDLITDKVTCIENRLDNANESIKNIKYPKIQAVNSSKLEQLSEDILEAKDANSTEEESRDESARDIRKFRDKRVMITLGRNETREGNKTSGDLACGEDIPGPLGTTLVTHLGLKPDRPSKLPARFCWTEAATNG